MEDSDELRRKKMAKLAERKIKSILRVVGEAAYLNKPAIVIPLKIIDNYEEDVLLAELVVNKLQKQTFDVYYREYGHPVIKEYCVKWCKNSAEIPEGFMLVPFQEFTI